MAHWGAWWPTAGNWEGPSLRGPGGLAWGVAGAGLGYPPQGPKTCKSATSRGMALEGQHQPEQITR